MDTLCHFFYNDKMYNGYSRDEVTTEHGASQERILNFKNGIITRGILMDIARLKGVDYLEPDTRIYPEDLDAWEKGALEGRIWGYGFHPDGALGAARRERRVAGF